MIIAVLAVCFAFLWPSISWYVRTPKEDKVLALSSLENIKNYSSFRANSEVRKLVDAVKANPEAPVPEDNQWLLKQAKMNFKAAGEKFLYANRIRTLLFKKSRRFKGAHARPHCKAFCIKHNARKKGFCF